MRASVAGLAAGLLLFLSGAVAGQGEGAGERGVGPSGLPLPRFVSLSAEEANLRTGPGRRYPILWVYRRAGLPLEITAEYGNWRRVRDWDGTQGWMHSALLSGNRTALVTGATRPLLRRPEAGAPVLLEAEAGVSGPLEECGPGWCRMRLAGREAWIRREFIWGVHPGEGFD